MGWPWWKKHAILARRTFVAALFQNNALGIAKAAAYSALLAFFPVLTTGATILVQTRAEVVAKTISEFLFEVVPPGTQELVEYTFVQKGYQPLLLVIVAVLLSVWAASGVVSSLMQGFQLSYRITRNRPIVKNKAVAILLVLLSTVPLLAASALVLFGGLVDQAIMHWISGEPMFTRIGWWWGQLYRFLRYSIAFAATVSVTCLLYYFGPYRKQQWRQVWRGAVLATVLWLLATTGFAWYVQHVGNYNVLYGSIGASIALLVWMYLLALIALFGCEFNAQYERNTKEHYEKDFVSCAAGPRPIDR